MRRECRIFWVLPLLVATSGCGRPSEEGNAAPTGKIESRRVHFVGFDSSEPLNLALKAGKIEGLVVQDPLRMGELGVKTVVNCLEKRKVEPVVDTGETMVTPENLSDPRVVELLNPPRAENLSGENLSGARKKKWRILVIPKGTTHEFWKTIHFGAKKAADELGTVDLVWQGPQKEDDRLQQIQLVQTAIASRIDGIVLAPLDSRALVKPVEEAVARGIPVVIIDSALDSNKISSFVATNNENGGALAARRLGQLLKGQGKIILMRYMVGSASTEAREKGFTETMAKEFPGVS